MGPSGYASGFSSFDRGTSKFCSSSSSCCSGWTGDRIVSSVVVILDIGGSDELCDDSSGNKGNDGDDWKCLRVAGRPMEGVGGMASLISCGGALLVPGVRRVKPRLLGFRFAGVGGFTKVGEEMAWMLMESLAGRGRLVVEAAARVCGRDVFTARFLRLRPFLGGGCFCSSKKGRLSSDVRGRSMPTANVVGGGLSGDEPGEGSVALESSTVEMVVVGLESLDPVVLSLK